MPSKAKSEKSNALESGTKLSFTWQHEAPKFKSDVDIYIWQRDQQPPTFQYADIFVLSNRTDQVQKLLILFKSTRLLKRFGNIRQDETLLKHEIVLDNSWSPINELLLSIIAVYMQMIEETGVFIQSSIIEINKMVCLSTKNSLFNSSKRLF